MPRAYRSSPKRARVAGLPNRQIRHPHTPFLLGPQHEARPIGASKAVHTRPERGDTVSKREDEILKNMPLVVYLHPTGQRRPVARRARARLFQVNLLGQSFRELGRAHVARKIMMIAELAVDRLTFLVITSPPTDD